MSKLRRQNERDWHGWEDLPDHVRRYWPRRPGRVCGHQILWKEVRFNPASQLETTLRMWQEIYDDDGRLIEVHHKYPDDTGHQTV